jgi:ubiquinone/menaquinone biosynthesis C-methylase UbiE
MNDLEKYFTENKGRLISKWKHYFEIYDNHFSRFRGTDVHVVELGVYQGGSLQMWKNYFGPNAKIFGVDINPLCKQFEEDQIKIFTGDQEDRKFLKGLAEQIPRIDILIDDGGHTMNQQINTFEELFFHIGPNGVYLCEDLHTSYWPEWGGGYKDSGTYIEYSKRFIDQIHAWHSRQTDKLNVTDFTRSVHSLHYYDSILVIERKPIEKPFDMQTGTREISDYCQPQIPAKSSSNGLKSRIKRTIDLLTRRS